MKKSITVAFRGNQMKMFPTEKTHEGKSLFRSNRNYYTIEGNEAAFVSPIPDSERPIRKSGGGRKTKGDTPKIQVSWWLDPKAVEIIRKQPNQAEYIETAVREKSERDATLS